MLPGASKRLAPLRKETAKLGSVRSPTRGAHAWSARISMGTGTTAPSLPETKRTCEVESGQTLILP